MLRLSDSGLCGSLQGRTVQVQAQQGTGPRREPGCYRLLPPVEDPIYGSVIMAVPVREAPAGFSYDLKNVLVSSSHRTGLPDSSFAIAPRQLPGVPTVVVYNGHAGLVMAVREAAGRAELTVI